MDPRYNARRGYKARHPDGSSQSQGQNQKQEALRRPKMSGNQKFLLGLAILAVVGCLLFGSLGLAGVSIFAPATPIPPVATDAPVATEPLVIATDEPIVPAPADDNPAIPAQPVGPNLPNIEYVQYPEGDVTIPPGYSFNTGEFDYNGMEATNTTGNVYYVVNDTDNPITIRTVGGGMANSIDVGRLTTIELDGGCGPGGCSSVTVFLVSNMTPTVYK